MKRSGRKYWDFSSLEINERIATLKDYVQKNPRNLKKGYINLHIHTNESFSVFKSPTEAVWYAYRDDIEYFGINDHYTIDGHDEFRLACEVAGIKPTFSIEAIAMDEEAFRSRRRYNDPNNPGRCYLIGKGVVRKLLPGGRGERLLRSLTGSIRERNRKITEKLNRYLEDHGFHLVLSYDEVEALTPRGNTTERHVVQALCERLNREFTNLKIRKQVYSELLKCDVDENTLLDKARLLTLVREKLVKIDRPCYVEEDPSAFTSIQNLVELYLEYGSVPTYPFMGNPITEEEEDLEALISRVMRNCLYALDIIDYRTEVWRAREIIEVASHYGLPVFIGTEHNTKDMVPLVGPVASQPEFDEYFRRSANFVIGHQVMERLCNFGAVTPEGRPRFEDLREGFQFYTSIGEMNLSRQQIEELEKNNLAERKRFFHI
ncbi:MAG: PHP domain-containing protein [Spirochaetota bacterium]